MLDKIEEVSKYIDRLIALQEKRDYPDGPALASLYSIREKLEAIKKRYDRRVDEYKLE